MFIDTLKEVVDITKELVAIPLLEVWRNSLIFLNGEHIFLIIHLHTLRGPLMSYWLPDGFHRYPSGLIYQAIDVLKDAAGPIGLASSSYPAIALRSS